MTNYHINQKTGNINICRAKPGNCPLKDEKGEAAPHFENKVDAQLFLEQDLKSQYGTTQTLEKQKVESIKLDIHQISEYIDPIYADYHYSYESNEYGGESIDEDSVYLHFVNVEAIAKNIAGKDNDDWVEVQEILEKHGAEYTENYSIEIYDTFITKIIEIDFHNKYQAVEDLKKYAAGDRSMLKGNPQDIKPATYTPNLSLFNDISNVVEIDYDFIDYYSNEIDENSVFITKIDEQEFANSMIDFDRKNKPSQEEKSQSIQEAREILEKIGAFNPDNYKAEVEHGYYDEYSITLRPKDPDFAKKFETEYYNKSNAKDNYGILEYVRSKGQETTGLTPINSIKEQLRNENPDRTSSLVEKSTDVSSKTLKLENIKIGSTHRYQSVDAREAKSENNSEEIAGVVFYDKSNKSYRLIDGYHRMKGLKSKNRKTGKYIVLS